MPSFSILLKLGLSHLRRLLVAPATLLVLPKRTLVVVALMLMPARALAQSDTYSESSIKAAFVYNFFKFIELSRTPSTDVRLCVVASHERCDALRAVDGKALAQGVLRIREVKVESVQSELSVCDAIFVGATDRSTTVGIIELAIAHRILTIGEDPYFLEWGGAINFYVESGKVRFEVDLDHVEKSGAKISSKLLKLGKVFGAKAQKGEP